jgi:AcrR family transcriptional regulator
MGDFEVSEGGAPRHAAGAGDERRRALVEAACELIVEKGFEGLRVRDIAARVGINHATLHYHFPTKEDLIRAVLDRLIEQVNGSKSEPPCHGPECGPLRDRLAQHFDEVLGLMDTRPELFIALSELHLRGQRDPAISAILRERDAGWHDFLCAELRDGVTDGSVRPDIDIEAAAQMVMTLFKGMAFRMQQSDVDPRRMVRQLEGWLFTPRESLPG